MRHHTDYFIGWSRNRCDNCRYGSRCSCSNANGAAELAVPVLNEELLRISERRSRLEQSFYISYNNEQNVSNDYKTLMCLSNLSGFMKVKRLN